MKPEQIDAIAEVMSRRRLTRVSIQVHDGFVTGPCEFEMSPLGFSGEFEMSPLGFSMPETEDKPATQPIGTENGGYPTEDELLLWSAGLQPSINAEAPKEP